MQRDVTTDDLGRYDEELRLATAEAIFWRHQAAALRAGWRYYKLGWNASLGECVWAWTGPNGSMFTTTTLSEESVPRVPYEVLESLGLA